MKRTLTLIPTLVIAIIASGMSAGHHPVATSQNNVTSAPPTTTHSCTIFAASFGDTVLFGNNEDYTNPETYYWINPPDEENYGGLFFGFDNLFPQGGVNEKGLCYDGNALPPTPMNSHPELPTPPGQFIFLVMQKCSTVEEVINLIQSYYWGDGSLNCQIHFADATGDAVVISASADGEFAFTRKEKRDGYLVSTNFNLANPSNRIGAPPCRRYDTAVAMLEEIRDEDDLTIAYFKSILDAVHTESSSVNTQYSNIFDLRNGIIYVYYFHQFDEVVELNLAEELARGAHSAPIRDLFSQETVDKASAKYQSHTTDAEEEIDRLLASLSDDEEEETPQPTTEDQQTSQSGSLDWKLVTSIIAGSVIILSVIGVFGYRNMTSHRRDESTSID